MAALRAWILDGDGSRDDGRHRGEGRQQAQEDAHAATWSRSGASGRRLARCDDRVQEALDRQAVVVRPGQHGRLERGLGLGQLDSRTPGVA